MKANERPINESGLFRCCIRTIKESDIDFLVGEVLGCKFCRGMMRLDETWVWHWAGEREET